MNFDENLRFSLKIHFFQTLITFARLVALRDNYAESAPYDRCLKTIEPDFSVSTLFFQKNRFCFTVRSEKPKNAPKTLKFDENQWIWMKNHDFRFKITFFKPLSLLRGWLLSGITMRNRHLLICVWKL